MFMFRCHSQSTGPETALQSAIVLNVLHSSEVCACIWQLRESEGIYLHDSLCFSAPSSFLYLFFLGKIHIVFSDVTGIMEQSHFKTK